MPNFTAAQFKQTLKTKLENHSYPLPEEEMVAFVNDISDCIEAINNDYALNCDMPRKIELHVLLHNLLYSLKCRHIQQYFLGRDRDGLKDELAQLLLTSYVAAVPSEYNSEAHTNMHAFAKKYSLAYVNYVLEMIKPDKFRLDIILANLRDTIVNRAMADITTSVGFDIYAIFNDNLAKGFNYMFELVNVEVSLDNIIEYVQRNLPYSYNFDRPSLDPNLIQQDPCSLLHSLKNMLIQQVPIVFNPIAISNAFQNFMALAAKHHNKIQNVTPEMSIAERHELIHFRYRCYKMANNTANTWAAAQSGSFVTTFFEAQGAPHIATLFLEFQNGAFELELKNTIINCVMAQLMHFYELPESLKTAPSQHSKRVALKQS